MQYLFYIFILHFSGISTFSVRVLTTVIDFSWSIELAVVAGSTHVQLYRTHRVGGVVGGGATVTRDSTPLNPKVDNRYPKQKYSIL